MQGFNAGGRDAEVLIAGAGDGTPFGQFTLNAGLAAIFDEDNSETHTACGAVAGGNPGQFHFAGLDFGSKPKRITKVIIYASSNRGYMSSPGGRTIQLYMHADPDTPSVYTDGTQLDAFPGFTDGVTAQPKTLPSVDTHTRWRYVWATTAAAIDGGAHHYLAELEFYEWKT